MELPYVTTVNTNVRVPRGQGLELSHFMPQDDESQSR